jgi:hypothetical protein
MRDTGFTGFQGSPSMSPGSPDAAIKTASRRRKRLRTGHRRVAVRCEGKPTARYSSCASASTRQPGIRLSSATSPLAASSRTPIRRRQLLLGFRQPHGRLRAALCCVHEDHQRRSSRVHSWGRQGSGNLAQWTRIANDTGATASAAGGSGNFLLGAVGGTNSDDQNIYLFGISNRAWSDAEVKEWSRNPWQLFAQTDRRYFLPAAASPPAVSARPQVFIAT